MGYGPRRQPCTALHCFKPITCSSSFHTYRGSTKRNFPSRLCRDVNSSSSHSHSTSLVKLGRDTRPTPTRKNGLTAPPMGVSAVLFSFVASTPAGINTVLIRQNTKIIIKGAEQGNDQMQCLVFVDFHCAVLKNIQTSMNLSNRKFCGENLDVKIYTCNSSFTPLYNNTVYHYKYNVDTETKEEHINELHVRDS